MIRTVTKIEQLSGSPALPADKSISHRAAILAALARGTTKIANYSNALDPQSTLRVLEALGVAAADEESLVRIAGNGLDGFRIPCAPLDCGNSGTTMRLMSGVLSGMPFASRLTGDASLSRRPMRRIASPLRKMGADIQLTDGYAPILIEPVGALRAITYPLPIASAQVKSCVLLAGLFADGPTTVVENMPSRDHTERMMGLSVEQTGTKRRITVEPGMDLPSGSVSIPADFSAAAFFIIAALTVPGSSLLLENVGINPTRSALLDVLREMGGSIELKRKRIEGREPVANLEVRHSRLSGISVDPVLVPNLIDEFPALLVAASQASGKTRITGAEELRHKETDRLLAMASNLSALGAHVDELPDGISIEGGHTLVGTSVDAFDDHRIAMAMGIAGLLAEGKTTIVGAESAAVSFPGFWEELEQLTINN